jgi:DnaJ homolog subfamily C member 9
MADDEEHSEAEEVDLYKVIGVERTASASQIKKAYFKAALTCHPDKCADENAKEQFQLLSKAHSILSDPEKRKLYDETGIIDDGSDEMDMSKNKSARDWEDYFRAQFPAVTLEKIEEFAKEYVGSEEERGHVLDAFMENEGFCENI